jgi:hypothetical protein
LATGLVAATWLGGVAAAPAQAATRYRVVCQDVLVRARPLGPGVAPPNFLYYGDTFDSGGTYSSGYRYGYAYGRVNQSGWVSANCLEAVGTV